MAYCTSRRLGFGLAIAIGLAVLGLSVTQTSAQDKSNVRPPPNAVGSGTPAGTPPVDFDTQLWKKARQGVQGQVSIPDTKAGVLVQAQGDLRAADIALTAVRNRLRILGRSDDEIADLEKRDRVGAELPLKADAGCRNTVFNNRAQTGADYVQRLLALGARHFRVEFVTESADEVRRTLDRYQKLLRGELSGAEVWRELKLLNQLGVTRGQMDTTPQVIFKKR